ncbi:hypothetical protein HRG_009193 [Hirsutella rhossiliensis]|uniref:Aflatoxin regulatory protein domain-containing protein n=1 Tax=Hirsutella rhossiliensis TaxID=111463 RepID=A0A9P8MSH8_9HYPO|nr:uncharacterized protein HRG_09193 [Hirsutella rhossiliensis]KAH0959411.1 hypothetical protein HRG_09193 [Hirsutella rhossiliensis]
MTPLSASPIFAAMPEPLSSDYLITPASGNDEAFMMADLDSDYPNDGSLAASMLLDMCSEQPDYLITPASTTDDYCLYTMGPCPPETLLVDDGPRPGFHDDPQRQLLELQQSLFEGPCAVVMVEEVDGLQKTIDLTTRASNMLLSIIMALIASTSGRLSSSPPSSSSSSSSPAPDRSRRASSGSGTTTMLLVTACYARILHNVDAIATRLHDMVSSSDQAALLALLPCVQIGSLMPATVVAPAIQTSVLVQLLSQSLREIEKRMPPLARAVLDQPLTSTRGLSSGGRSHIAEIVGAVNSEVAGLEAHVKNVLSVTLDLLSHSGSHHGHGMYYTME